MLTNRAGKISNRAVKDVFNRILATVMVVALMLSVVPLNTVNAAESFSFMYSSAADNSVKSGDRVLVKRSSGSDDYEPFDYYDEDSKPDTSEEIFEIGTDVSLFDPMQTKSFGTIS
ncbi:MAG: hypothetical protein K6G60_06480 [Lachnospiraceae bacterium]|nr:hypothetical protein [Lachnospiraceae bacterium]